MGICESKYFSIYFIHDKKDTLESNKHVLPQKYTMDVNKMDWNDLYTCALCNVKLHLALQM